MKRIIFFIVSLTLFISCKDDAVKKPKRLIKKEVMVDIMYDISLLDAIKYQNPTSIDSLKINPRDFIFKKYKVDSLQFATSNVYYSTDYEGYKVMFDEVAKRINKEKKSAEDIVKAEQKKLKNTKNIKLEKTQRYNSDTLVRGRKGLIDKEMVKEPAMKMQAVE
ncbi:DUF4296 domain-containing protein [Flavobacterium sp. P4023]|uniref:DUF4296 domain-containing protein n=1 Tax=Flavobacterium flabelliforme TaxID=2816119 RepID=A0ABS5CQG1_9FLAO|nr:DUF4296 domain-containing protein [Flavobacterium flabelliforme]MBP4140863.1 DUF4296 domain-containing protein [Flavobacterium flabelliforme]